jgi:hypothetical protein
MNTETIEYRDYTIHIEQDTDACNPFTDFDCEPPLLVYYDGCLTKYGDAPDIGDLVDLIPDHHFSRGNRVKLIREWLNVSLREFAEERKYYGRPVREQFAESLSEQCPNPEVARGRGWGSDATAYFEALESLCKLAKVPFYYGQSNGYSQGDSALVIAFAMPAWAKMVGAPEHTLESQCKGAFDLYSAWAWGDCYGISSIEDPEGNEIEEGSCWGFYGDDHEKSGLLPDARATIDADIKLAVIAKAEDERAKIKEQEECATWEARDTVTV